MKGLIPATLLTQCVKIKLTFLSNSKNYIVFEGIVSNELKIFEVIVLFKKRTL